MPIVLRAGGHTSVLNTRAFEVSDVVRFAGQAGMMGGTPRFKVKQRSRRLTKKDRAKRKKKRKR